MFILLLKVEKPGFAPTLNFVGAFLTPDVAQKQVDPKFGAFRPTTLGNVLLIDAPRAFPAKGVLSTDVRREDEASRMSYLLVEYGCDHG